MLKIRLSRTGKKKQPSFKVIVQEHTAPIKGKYVEELGFYKPATEAKEFSINLDRVKYWLSVGATPSDAMAVLLKKEGVDGMDKYIEPRNKQRKKKKEEEVKEAPKAETPAPEGDAAPAEEAPKEEAPKEEAPKEETPKEETPKEETPKEETPKEETPKEDTPKEEKQD